jgi:predicted PurR-regulated permease PerM
MSGKSEVRMKHILGDLPSRVLAFAIFLAVVGLAIYTLKILLVPVVAASFVTYLFDPAIVSMQRRGMERSKAFLVLLGVSILGILLMMALAPQWLSLESINANGSNFSDRMEKQLEEIERSVTIRLPMLRSMNLTSALNKAAGDFGGRLFNELPSLITSFVLNLILVPFIAYFMVRDGKTLRRKFISLVPNRYFEMSLMMLHRIDGQIGGYLRGRLIECTLVAFTQVLAMSIALLFVPQPQILLISGVIGATNLIPYLGPLMGAGFGVMLYLGVNGLPISSVYGLLIATLVAHLVDNIAIAPLVLSHNVDLHPLAVALVLVIGGELLGVLGLLIAIPVAASVKVIVQEVYTNYQLQTRTASEASGG